MNFAEREMIRWNKSKKNNNLSRWYLFQEVTSLTYLYPEKVDLKKKINQKNTKNTVNTKSNQDRVQLKLADKDREKC